MIGKLQQNILELLLDNYQNKLSINQIASALNLSYPSVFAKTKELIKQQLISQEKIGNALFCSLNLENDLLRNILSHIAIIRRNTFLLNHADEKSLLSTISDLSSSFSIVTVFMHSKTTYICLNNPFEIDAFSARLGKKPSLNIKLITSKDLYLITPQMIAQSVILYNPEHYFTALARSNGGKA